MKLTELDDAIIRGEWTHEPFDLFEAVKQHHHPQILFKIIQPRLCIRLNEVLTEATYKEIARLIDPNFLNQKVRADELDGIFYKGFDNDTMKFQINRSKHKVNNIQYQNWVQFVEWDEFGNDPDLNAAEKARMLAWIGNLKLWCRCPRYLYWGYQWIQTIIDAAIYPEDRPPNIRNPKHRGAVCKHQNRLLRAFPFYLGDIAKEIKQQFG